MDDCIFCKIINEEIPTEFVYKDDFCRVFKDIHPKAKTHLLIVPLRHIPSIAEMRDGDERVVGHLMKCAQTVAKQFGLEGYNLQINVGKEAGQEVFHLHIHLMSHLG